MPAASERRRFNGVLAAVAACSLLAFAMLGFSVRHEQEAPVALADLVDPDGVNPQRVVDTFNDLNAAETQAISKVRNIMAKLKKLADKKLSIIVDTQSLKTGGRPGPPGPRGRKGKPGYQGPAGAEGDRGPQGFTGPQGNQGKPGTMGFRGETGDTGPEGDRGDTGEVGAPGYPGPPGPRGPLGTPGKRGKRGPRGQTGYQGNRGAIGMPGMKGMVGPRGAIHIMDLGKICNEKGGMMYGGICLMSQAITSNADDVPTNCNAYQPWMWWGWEDYKNINALFARGKYTNPEVNGWGNGGRCTNFRAILSFTRWNGNNHVWVRYGTFYWNPHHMRTSWQCWWWWCWSYEWQHCHLYSGGDTLAVYACTL